MLTREQILLLLERIAEETVVEPNKEFPYRISRKGFGYSKDKQIASIQATLSIMLEMASRKK